MDIKIGSMYHKGNFKQKKNYLKNISSEAPTMSQHEVPMSRMWETIRTHAGPPGTTMKFRVVSYNVLAQDLLDTHRNLYRRCKPSDTQWPIRSARLYQEIKYHNADILCLQEVQEAHVPTFYAWFLELGYEGIYKKKTGGKTDGCAIFFKREVFKYEISNSVEFYQPHFPMLNRHNVGLMMRLAPHFAPDYPLVVATAHLLYNPRRDDVRMAQTQLLLAELDRFAYHRSRKLPIILTGDFNSPAESPVAELLHHGKVDASVLRHYSTWETLGITDGCQHLQVIKDREAGRPTQYTELKIYNSEYCSEIPEPTGELANEFRDLFNGKVVSQTLDFSSVYDASLVASTNQGDWVTVDYIFFSNCRSLKLYQRLILPTPDDCNEVDLKLPNETFASDHLALAAAFLFDPYNT